jgi:capsular polysaccharide biosynthesis protein
MELRQYWRIVYRRLWIVIALVAVVLVSSLVSSLVLQPGPATFCQTSMRFTVAVVPESRNDDYYAYDRYYTWMASEYFVDELTEIVGSEAFARAVSEELANSGLDLSAEALHGSMGADRKHRILTVHITWGKQEQLGEIANAAARALQKRSADFLGQLGTTDADIRLIDPPVVLPAGRSLKEKLDLPIRLFLALVAGIALAFLLDYLDDTVRDRAEVEAIGLAVLGEIPPLPGRRRFPWEKKLP